MKIAVMLRGIGERQGTGIYTQNVVDRLLAMDTANEYVCLYNSQQDLGRYAHLDHVTERVLSVRHKALWDQVAVPMAARREDVDVIFHPKFTVPFFTGRKTVMTIHGASWFVHPELYGRATVAYIRLFMPFYCRRANLILSNSELTTNDFVRILKVPREKIVTIPLGVTEQFKVIEDRNRLDEVRQRYNLPEKFILSVSRYDPRKNFVNLIAAFRLLRQRTSCKLVVAGIGCEKYREEFHLDDDGTADDVLFLDWVNQDELPALYNMARCLFFPSVYEEFGIPTCEAMSCDCPPVISKTGNLPSIAGDAGIVVDPFDHEEMADALEKVYTDDSLHAQLVARCRERAPYFTWERCARETLDALNRIGALREA